MRVLHIVESLDRGAVENWLLRMLAKARAQGRTDVDWTFYCALAQTGAKEPAAHALGARVIRSPVPIGRKLAIRSRLARTNCGPANMTSFTATTTS